MDFKREMVPIGERLKAARKRAGATQEDAAAVTRVVRSTISNWEAGRNMPCLVQFRSLLTLYGEMGYQILFGHKPVEFSDTESRELDMLMLRASPSLQRKMSIVKALMSPGGDGGRQMPGEDLPKAPADALRGQ
jgi:transcriptional regulator with XRE-family HTH domain